MLNGIFIGWHLLQFVTTNHCAHTAPGPEYPVPVGREQEHQIQFHGRPVIFQDELPLPAISLEGEESCKHPKMTVTDRQGQKEPVLNNLYFNFY